MSVGTNLEAPLSEMMALLQNGQGIAARKVTVTERAPSSQPSLLSSGRAGGNGGGAKFVRP